MSSDRTEQTYAFSVRLALAGAPLAGPEPSLSLSGPTGPELVLSAADRESPLGEARDLVLEGSGYRSAEEAARDRDRWLDGVRLASASLRVGVDIGGVEDPFATGAPAAEPSHPAPTASVEAAAFREAVAGAAATERSLTGSERLSSHYRNAAGSVGAEARFVLLMLAVEALIVRQPRVSEAAAHLNTLIARTKESEGLSADERSSIISSLNGLKLQSVGQGGRQLASLLVGQTFSDKTPEKFFAYAYAMRTHLAHGNAKRPQPAELRAATDQLELFVDALLVRGLDEPAV